MDFTQMTISQLTELKNEIEGAIEAKQQAETKTYAFDWDSGVCDSRKGKPYAAIITGMIEGKLERSFCDLTTSYGKKGTAVQVYGDIIAKEGQIVERREGGSWKNDYRYFYIVQDGKLNHLGDATSASMKTKVGKYVSGKISLEKLLSK